MKRIPEYNLHASFRVGMTFLFQAPMLATLRIKTHYLQSWMEPTTDRWNSFFADAQSMSYTQQKTVYVLKML